MWKCLFNDAKSCYIISDIGDISPFSYFKEFGGNVPIAETGDVYSGTLYQNNNQYQTVKVEKPSKEEEKPKEDKVEEPEPIFYYQGEYEEYKDPNPPKQEGSSSGKYKTPSSNTQVNEFIQVNSNYYQ